MSSDLTSPKYDTPRSLPNDHKKGIYMVLFMITF